MKSALTLLVILPFLVRAAFAQTPPPAGVVLERDVPFLAPDRAEKLDLYQPESRTAGTLSPAVVIIHGGGWVGGDKAAQREFITGTTLAKAGYVAVSINYWLGAKERWPTNLQDCKNAVRWLRVNAERLRIDPEKIGVIGGSAGGHLALMVAYTAGNTEIDPKPLYPDVSDHVSACVNMYGISNLLTRQGTDKSGNPNGEVKSSTQLFTQTATAAPEKWKLASPVSHIKPNSPPTLTLHGVADTTVDRAQSEELDRALKAAGLESILIMVPGANHAWPLKTAKFDYTGDVVEFFNRHLKAEK
jgi:acetyl esterase/lipase